MLLEMKASAFSILATDIDEACLERARQGIFDSRAVRISPRPQLSAFFEFQESQAKVGPELRKVVRVERHNLFSDPVPGAFDLVLCRNVMIYFSRELQQRLLEAFFCALRPGGFLIPGKTETILGPVRQLFHCVSARARVFQRV
jgi:chemotaxis protein methyltransferase CheR